MPTVRLLSQPYSSLSSPVALDGVDREGFPKGALAVVRLERAEGTPQLLDAWLPAARRRHPWCTFVVQLLAFEERQAAAVLLVAGRAGIRACVLGESIAQEQLRRNLCDPTGLEECVIDWLLHASAHGPVVGGELARGVFGQPPIGGAARAQLRALGLPSPLRWRQLVRALRTLLQLQANPALSIEAVALAGGFADHASLWRLTRTLFGITPSEVRGTMGWEWLADRWLRRFSRR
jgi:AraC-like DNA-binding protein